jgi:hypothetical protein
MPFMLTFFERQIFLRHAWGPGPILDMFGALAFKSVSAAVKLDLFEKLEELGPSSAAQLSIAIGADEHGMHLLLQTLASLGYLRCTGKTCFANAPMTTAWMLKKSPCNLAAMLGYFEDACLRWDNLDQSIRSGKPFERGDAWLDRHEGAWDRYHAGMYSIARLMADEIVRRAALSPHARRMLDIGGSHGFYSIRFCQRHPLLNAVIFDTQPARATAEQTIKQHEMHNRVSFKEGDFLNDDLGAEYDVALLFNVIRIYPEREALMLLRKIRAALAPKARLLVADQFCTKLSPGFNKANALLILLELYNGCPSHTYSAAEVKAMLVTCGFDKPREIALRRSPGISMVTAERGM